MGLDHMGRAIPSIANFWDSDGWVMKISGIVQVTTNCTDLWKPRPHDPYFIEGRWSKRDTPWGY